MAERIVDGLEAVDVHEQKANPLGLSTGAVEKSLELLLDIGAVSQPGEHVVERQEMRFLFRLLEIGNVDLADQHGGRSGDRIAALARGYLMPANA
jgi:hypothetical protein